MREVRERQFQHQKCLIRTSVRKQEPCWFPCVIGLLFTHFHVIPDRRFSSALDRVWVARECRDLHGAACFHLNSSMLLLDLGEQLAGLENMGFLEKARNQQSCY